MRLLIRNLEDTIETPQTLVWNPDGQVIAYGMRVVRWDADSSRLLNWNRLPGPSEVIGSAPSLDGKSVLTIITTIGGAS